MEIKAGGSEPIKDTRLSIGSVGIAFDYTNTTPKFIGTVTGISEHFIELTRYRSFFSNISKWFPKDNVEALLTH